MAKRTSIGLPAKVRESIYGATVSPSIVGQIGQTLKAINEAPRVGFPRSAEAEAAMVNCAATTYSELAGIELEELIGSQELSLNLQLQAETIRQLAGLRDQIAGLKQPILLEVGQ